MASLKLKTFYHSDAETLEHLFNSWSHENPNIVIQYIKQSSAVGGRTKKLGTAEEQDLKTYHLLSVFYFTGEELAEAMGEEG